VNAGISPMIVMGCFGIMGVISSIGLKETKDCKLLDEIEEIN
jgi:hypothetical protein